MKRTTTSTEKVHVENIPLIQLLQTSAPPRRLLDVTPPDWGMHCSEDPSYLQGGSMLTLRSVHLLQALQERKSVIKDWETAIAMCRVAMSPSKDYLL